MSKLINTAKHLKVLFKKGWVLYPEIMSSHVLSTLGLIGFGIMSFAFRNYVHIPRTFNEPVFLRPQDPRAKKTLTFYEEGWDEKYP